MYNTWSTWNSPSTPIYSQFRPTGMSRCLHNLRSNRGQRHPVNQNIRHFNMVPVSQPIDMPPPRMMGPPQYIGIRRPVTTFQRSKFIPRGAVSHLPRLPQPPIHPSPHVVQQHFGPQHIARRQSWPQRKRPNESPNRRGARGIGAKRSKMGPKGGKRKSGIIRGKILNKTNPLSSDRHNKSLSQLDPSDPLNIHSLIAESEKRARLGQPPQSGDSTFNTPSVSEAGDNYASMCVLSPIEDISVSSPAPPISTEEEKCESVATQPILKKQFLHNPRFQGKQRGRGGRRGTGYQYGRRHGRHQPVTGNYSDYYMRRDPRYRLDLMCDWFTGKDILDYGCNNGTFTLMLLEKFPDLRKLDAMDCDGELIQNARHMLREKGRREAVRSAKEGCVPSVDYNKVNFQSGDWLGDISMEDVDCPEYDVIMAFSVSKWIHLNHGDSGLTKFFRLVFNRLRPGGHFIIEPQPKKSYKKSIQLPIHQTNCNSIRIDPSNLEPILADLGFCYFEHIDMPKRNEPFRRRILLCTKASGHTPIPIRDCAVKKAHQWCTYDIALTSSNRNIPPAVEYPTPSSSYYSPGGPHITSPLLNSGSYVTSTTAEVSSSDVSRTLITADEPIDNVVSSAHDLIHSAQDDEIPIVESTMHSPDSSGGANDVEEAEAAEMGSVDTSNIDSSVGASLDCVVNALVSEGQHFNIDNSRTD